MKVKLDVLEDVFDYLFDIIARKFLSEKEKRYLYELFEKKKGIEHLELDENCNDYLENDELDNIVGDEGIQNLNMGNQFGQF